MATFLLELRTEEIPANALAGARRQLEKAYSTRLTEAGFEPQVDVQSTNRRLVVRVEGLPERQADRTEVVNGPPTRVAFGEDGAPTKAAEGFARKVGLAVDQLSTVSTDKGEYISATVTFEGRATAEILSEITPEILRAMRFPKMMRWGLGTHLFVRPVHGMVALFDEQVVACEAFGINAGRTTVGHRVHSPAAFELQRADDYQEELLRRRVIVDPEQRRRILEEAAHRLASEVDCQVHADPALVAEHVELVECPGLLRGEIDPAFLELPREVVITTLRHHQKCLVLERADGELSPFFLTVIDRDDDPEGLIRLGNEWVIGARLADAGFFFAEDRKKKLEELVPGLARLEFHRRLGSLADKADRVAEAAGVMSEWLGLDLTHAEIRRAVHLAKADLMCNMVVEFPELQGIMGGHYLRLEGEAEALWTAARDHYRPQGFEGQVPVSDLGRLVGIADRLDTLAGLFGAGEIPSGSRDPFGLRRAAQAVVRIIDHSSWDMDLVSAIGCSVALVEQKIERDVDEVQAEVQAFMADRVRRYLVDVLENSQDTAEAVMAAGWGRLPSLVARAAALEKVRTDDEFRSLALAFKRVRNITDGQPEAEVDPELFEQSEEKELWQAVCAFHDDLEIFLGERKLDQAFAAMGPLAEVLDRFFVEVLVMADDERIRANRIALLKTLGRDFLTLADLSKLQVEGGDK